MVGPEAPLAAGIVDQFRAAGRRIVGPTAAAARLEASKTFAKEFMMRAGIPTARFTTVSSIDEARAALDEFELPVVLKADGLAAGKGVIIANNRAEAESAVQQLLQPGSSLVIEEFLRGEEVSFIVLSDGVNILPLEPTQDHKTVDDGDTGPNTGGMGAYCDGRILDDFQKADVMARIIRPAIQCMRSEGVPFSGFLYAGLMMTAQGPKVLEFNARLGDPETQVLMHRMESDFVEPLFAAAHGALDESPLNWHADPSVCVVVAAAGISRIGANRRSNHGTGQGGRRGSVSGRNKIRQQCSEDRRRSRARRDFERAHAGRSNPQHLRSDPSHPFRWHALPQRHRSQGPQALVRQLLHHFVTPAYPLDPPHEFSRRKQEVDASNKLERQLLGFHFGHSRRVRIHALQGLAATRDCMTGFTQSK